MKRLITSFLAFSSVAGLAQTAPWQQLQMPTAEQVERVWASPPPEYGPEPYYGLNGPVDLAVIRHDLDTMKALGYGSVTVQAGYGMPVPYLSPEYFAFFRKFVDEAKQRNLHLWIVDDAGYPSGFAGGRFSAERPDLRMQGLTVTRRIPAKGGDKVKEILGPDVVIVSAVNSATGEVITISNDHGSIDWTAPAGDWSVAIVEHRFTTSPTRSDTNPKRVKDGSQSLEDYLNPAATQVYLSFTHELYKKAVGDEFGKTILGFRGDEPDYSISGLPWTPAFFDTFKRLKGYDVQPLIATFLLPPNTALSPAAKLVKADYYDVFSVLFRDGFFKPQADWCAANHLEYQVHLNHEELEIELARSEGDFFRAMRYVQVPGIDSIWHQIWTDTISDFPRLAASVAHVYGHPRAFTESFAAYRPEPDVTMARYILNEQFVRGVNLIETMYYPATSTPGRGGPAAYMRDPDYPALMQYTRRLSYLMSQGHPAASVALLLPTSSLWLNDTAADDTFVSTERLLSEHQVDFDVVDEDAIANVLKPGAGTLETMSGNRLHTVIVPHAAMISERTLERLRTLVAGGGHVLFLGGTPTHIATRTFREARAAKPSDFDWATICLAQLAPTPTPPAQPPTAIPGPQIVPAEVLADLRKVAPTEFVLDQPDTAVRYVRRNLDGATVFLIFNESAAPIRHRLTLQARGHHVQFWDPETATIKPASGVTVSEGSVQLPVELAPYATAVIVVR